MGIDTYKGEGPRHIGTRCRPETRDESSHRRDVINCEERREHTTKGVCTESHRQNYKKGKRIRGQDNITTPEPEGKRTLLILVQHWNKWKEGEVDV